MMSSRSYELSETCPVLRRVSRDLRKPYKTNSLGESVPEPPTPQKVTSLPLSYITYLKPRVCLTLYVREGTTSNMGVGRQGRVI